jgi:hypothetical protein
MVKILSALGVDLQVLSTTKMGGWREGGGGRESERVRGGGGEVRLTCGS